MLGKVPRESQMALSLMTHAEKSHPFFLSQLQPYLAPGGYFYPLVIFFHMNIHQIFSISLLSKADKN